MDSRFLPSIKPIFQIKRERGERRLDLWLPVGWPAVGSGMTTRQLAVAAAGRGVVRPLGRGASRRCVGWRVAKGGELRLGNSVGNNRELVAAGRHWRATAPSVDETAGKTPTYRTKQSGGFGGHHDCRRHPWWPATVLVGQWASVRRWRSADGALATTERGKLSRKAEK